MSAAHSFDVMTDGWTVMSTDLSHPLMPLSFDDITSSLIELIKDDAAPLDRNGSLVAVGDVVEYPENHPDIWYVVKVVGPRAILHSITMESMQRVMVRLDSTRLIT